MPTILDDIPVLGYKVVLECQGCGAETPPLRVQENPAQNASATLPRGWWTAERASWVRLPYPDLVNCPDCHAIVESSRKELDAVKQRTQGQLDERRQQRQSAAAT